MDLLNHRVEQSCSDLVIARSEATKQFSSAAQFDCATGILSGLLRFARNEASGLSLRGAQQQSNPARRRKFDCA
jgi:hypothetical protein